MITEPSIGSLDIATLLSSICPEPILPTFDGKLQFANAFIGAVLLAVDDWLERPNPPSDSRLATAFLKSPGAYPWALQFSRLPKDQRPAFASLVAQFKKDHFLDHAKNQARQYLSKFTASPGLDFFDFIKEFTVNLAEADISDSTIPNYRLKDTLRTCFPSIWEKVERFNPAFKPDSDAATVLLNQALMVAAEFDLDKQPHLLKSKGALNSKKLGSGGINSTFQAQLQQIQQQLQPQVIPLATPSFNNPPLLSPSDPMVLDAILPIPNGPLTDLIRQRCYSENACLYCRQHGHRIAACPEVARKKGFETNKPVSNYSSFLKVPLCFQTSSVNAMFDTGALVRNYMSASCAARLGLDLMDYDVPKSVEAVNGEKIFIYRHTGLTSCSANSVSMCIDFEIIPVKY